MRCTINETILELVQGDITELAIDAIVNAANAQLILGGGLAGAIRQKGGPAIQAECDKAGPISVGAAAITTAGNLKAKHVIHAVGPRMGEGDEDNKLKNATLSTLRIADANNLKTIALPAISTGIFRFPVERCAPVMLKATIDYLKGRTQLEKVIFCLFDKNTFDIFAENLSRETEK